MSLALAYISIDPVSAEIKRSVLQDAVKKNADRRWWSDAIEFFEWPGHEGKLAGLSKLFLFGYSTNQGSYIQIDPGDDCYMAARDARFILDQLAQWSGQYEVKWQLYFDDCKLGTILSGELDDELFTAINELLVIGSEDALAVLEFDAIDCEDPERTERLNAEHSMRSAN